MAGLGELEGGGARASDRDRNRRVAEELRVHCVAGRITLEELERRDERAMSAQTIHQLAEVVYDLPTISVPEEPADRSVQSVAASESSRSAMGFV